MKTQVRTTLVRGPRPVYCALAVLLVTCASASARVHHNDAWGRQQFVKAERMREALNGRPAAERTRREYQQVIDAYRRVYFGAPTSSKADPSVVATAELMVEMGRRFDDNKILRGAVDQYRFLRKEYPGSRYRCDALFTIGEIYKDDLSDPEEARATFEEFLHRYPKNHLADDAQAALGELDAELRDVQKAARESSQKAHSLEEAEAQIAASGHDLPRVTGVRHWSTPDYTRIAIDVEQEIKFDSQRIDNPDRIFFDLRNTKLASTLVGKTFDVDDGFLKKIRVAQFQPGRARIVLEVHDLASYNAFLLPNPYRLIIDIHGKQSRDATFAKERERGDGELLAAGGQSDAPAEATEPVAKSKSVAADPSPKAANSDSITKTEVKVPGSNRKIPKTIVGPDDNAPQVAALDPADLRPEVTPAQRARVEATTGSKSAKKHAAHDKTAAAPDTDDLEIHEARPTAAGDRSLIRALGLKIGRIVIDAGHGGHDTGTIGPDGLLEKDLVLDVAKRLGHLLETRMGAEVVYTRQDDTFVPLETRTAIANQERADLFISIHANSSRDPDARGVETYYLNFTSSPEALEVAARENAVSETSIHELQDLVKKIALKEKIDESREFASDVQDSLYSGLSLRSAGIRNRGVKKAPFIVLIGANMPSILAEISFVSNPTDERRLETAEHRQRIAESLYRGVSKYVGGLSGVKVASKGTKSEGQ